MFLLLLWLSFTPLISSKPNGISLAGDEIGIIPAKLKREVLSTRQVPVGSTSSSSRPSLNSSLAIYLRKLLPENKLGSGEAVTGYGEPDTRNLVLKFEITKPDFEVKEIISADLHIYKRSSSPLNSATSYELSISPIPINGPPLLSAYLFNHEGWGLYNIKPIFETWFKDESSNYGLLLSATVRGKEVNPQKVGYVGFDGPIDKRPFIVVKYKKATSQNDNEEDNDDEHDKEASAGSQEPNKSREEEDDSEKEDDDPKIRDESSVEPQTSKNESETDNEEGEDEDKDANM